MLKIVLILFESQTLQYPKATAANIQPHNVKTLKGTVCALLSALVFFISFSDFPCAAGEASTCSRFAMMMIILVMFVLCLFYNFSGALNLNLAIFVCNLLVEKFAFQDCFNSVFAANSNVMPASRGGEGSKTTTTPIFGVFCSHTLPIKASFRSLTVGAAPHFFFSL